MASTKGTKKTAIEGLDKIELVPDAWPRFENFIKEIVKAGPQHRKPIEKPKAKARATAGKAHAAKKTR